MYVLPSECQLLDFYLRQPRQDPEWIQFVHERRSLCPPVEFEARFQSFLNIELCTSTREMVIDL